VWFLGKRRGAATTNVCSWCRSMSRKRSLNTRYAFQVRVSKVRSTHLRDTRPNRHNSSLPKLQCAGRRSENLYVTSPSTRAAHQVRMCKLRSTPLRDTSPNRPNSSVSKLQGGGHRSDYLYVTSRTTGATTAASTDKISGKKTLRDHRDFDRRFCGAARQ